MNEKNKKLWNDAINEINDKYISETAETMMKNKGKEIELTEIKIDKPAENEKHFKWLPYALSAVAAVAVIVCAGTILNLEGISTQRPSQTDINITVTTPVSVDPVTSDDEGVYEEIIDPNEQDEIGEAVAIKSAEFDNYEVHLAYEKQPTMTLSVYKDYNWPVEIDTGLKNNQIGNLKLEITSFSFSGGDIAFLYLPVLKESGTGAEYEIYLYHCSETDITPIKDINGNIFSVRTGKTIYDALCDKETDSFRLEYDLGHPKQTYRIDFENNTAEKYTAFPLDEDTTPLDYISFSDKFTSVTAETEIWLSHPMFQTESDKAENNTVFGSWVPAFGEKDNLNYVLNVTEPVGMYENQSGRYLSLRNGLIGFIPSGSRLMYTYPDANSGIEYSLCNYWRVYEYSDYSLGEKSETWYFDDEYKAVLEYTMGAAIECNYIHLLKNDETIADIKLGLKKVIINDMEPFFSGAELKDGKIVGISFLKDDGTVRGEYETYLYKITDNSIEEIAVFDENAQPSQIISVDRGFSGDINDNIIAFSKDTGGFNRYTIDFESNTATPIFLYSLDNDDSEFDLDFYAHEENGDQTFEIFETAFYGKWKQIYGIENSPTGIHTGETEYYLTYTGETKSSSQAGMRTGYEKDDGYYMTGISGGEMTLLYIPKNDMYHIFYYERPFECRKSAYLAVYERLDSPTLYDKSITTGSLSALGVKKLTQETGIDFYGLAGNDIEVNGKKMELAPFPIYDEGNFYLKEYTDTRIRYSLLYYMSENMDYNIENMIVPESRYITFTVEKTGDGEWFISNTEEFDTEPETGCMTYALLSMNTNLNVEYIPISEGRYYAVRTFGGTVGSPRYCELFYNDGYQYTLLDQTEGNATPCYNDGKMYFIGNKDNSRLALTIYEGTEAKIMEPIQEEKAESMSVVAESAAGYIFLYINVNQTHSYNYLFPDVPNMYMANIMKIKDVKHDPYYTGFTFTDMDGNEHIHRPESSDPNDSLWSLNYMSDFMWSFLNINMPFDGYLCEYSELYYFLYRYFTDQCASDIIYANFTHRGLVKGTKIYCQSGARGSNIEIADVTYKLKKLSDYKYEIVYDVYKWDDLGAENPTSHYDSSYSIPIVLTENGWRMEEFYSVY